MCENKVLFIYVLQESFAFVQLYGLWGVINLCLTILENVPCIHGFRQDNLLTKVQRSGESPWRRRDKSRFWAFLSWIWTHHTHYFAKQSDKYLDSLTSNGMPLSYLFIILSLQCSILTETLWLSGGPCTTVHPRITRQRAPVFKTLKPRGLSILLIIT